MKIKKNPVTAALEIEGAEVNEDKSVINKYKDAIDYISSAISSLSVIAKDDKLAKESIANLSVVLLDLKTE